MKKSNILKVMAIAASTLFLTGCPKYEPRKYEYTTAAWTITSIDEKSFPDPIFREYVLTRIDQDKDGILNSDEVHGTTVLEVNDLGIIDLTGINYFRELRELNCSGNYLEELDASGFRWLGTLTCNNNPLKELTVSGDGWLTALRSADTLLTSLDVSGLRNLTELSVDKDVEVIGAERDDLIVIRVARSSHPEWETIPTLAFVPPTLQEGLIPIDRELFPDDVFREYISDNCDTNGDGALSESEIGETFIMELQGLKIKDLTGLSLFFNVNYLNARELELEELDLSANGELEILICTNCGLKSLNLSNNDKLHDLFCGGNRLESLDVSQNLQLKALDCSENRLSSLDVTHNTALKYLRCDTNPLLKSLDLSNNPDLESLWCQDCSLTSLDLTHNPRLFLDEEREYGLVWPTISFSGNLFTYPKYPAGFVVIDAGSFPDQAFRRYIKTEIDKNDDGVLSDQEILATVSIDVSGLDPMREFLIQSLEGIEIFSELQYLNCSNNRLEDMDLSKNTKLKELKCTNNRFRTLDIAGYPWLETLCVSEGVNVTGVREGLSIVRE